MNDSQSWLEKQRLTAWVEEAHQKLDERETDEVEVGFIRDAPTEGDVQLLCKKIQAADIGFLNWSYRKCWNGFSIHATSRFQKQMRKGSSHPVRKSKADLALQIVEALEDFHRGEDGFCGDLTNSDADFVWGFLTDLGFNCIVEPETTRDGIVDSDNWVCVKFKRFSSDSED